MFHLGDVKTFERVLFYSRDMYDKKFSTHFLLFGKSYDSYAIFNSSINAALITHTLLQNHNNFSFVTNHNNSWQILMQFFSQPASKISQKCGVDGQVFKNVVNWFLILFSTPSYVVFIWQYNKERHGLQVFIL